MITTTITTTNLPASSASMRAEMRSARKAAGLRQADLAELVGVSPRTIVSWERGATAPTWEQWDRWLAALREEADPCRG